MTHNTKFCSRYFVAWYLGKNPKHRYLQGGHSQDFCEKEFGAPVRSIIQDPRYTEVFSGTTLNSRSTASSNWRLDNKKGGYVTKGVGQALAGYRGHCGGGDDLIGSKEQADSAIVREKVWKWLWADFRTRFLPHSPIFLIATRWHEDDPIGRIERYNKEGKGIPWEIINFNGVIENEAEAAIDPLGRDIGEPLWPSFYTYDMLMELKDTLDARDWNALYKGKPTDDAGGACKGGWFQRYEALPKDEFTDGGNLLKKNRRRVVVSVDTANKTTARSKYTAIGVWIEDMNHRHYLAEVVRKKVEFNQLITEIEGAATRWNASAILVEDKGSGTQYIQARQGQAPAPIIAIAPGAADKEFRFDGILPMIESGQVYLPVRARWLPEYEAEVVAFPNGTYSDQIDMTSQYLKWARVGRQYGTKKMKGAGRPT
ncbi:MAG: phage terminase large subunit [Xanthomonadales bacterium]|nr:phage terminase large subunit [Xanthomonadales bacterium]